MIEMSVNETPARDCASGDGGSASENSHVVSHSKTDSKKTSGKY